MNRRTLIQSLLGLLAFPFVRKANAETTTSYDFRNLRPDGHGTLYVDSSTGDDSPDAPYGTPFATLAAALAATASGDIIMVNSGHREQLNSPIDVPMGVSLHGEGEGDNRPTFSFNNSTLKLGTIINGPESACEIVS